MATTHDLLRAIQSGPGERLADLLLPEATGLAAHEVEPLLQDARERGWVYVVTERSIAGSEPSEIPRFALTELGRAEIGL